MRQVNEVIAVKNRTNGKYGHLSPEMESKMVNATIHETDSPFFTLKNYAK